jgi:hypothetical protein
MRPRRLFTFCSAVSLLLWVAVCVLWVRSYFRGDYADSHTEHVKGERWVVDEYWLISADGAVMWMVGWRWIDDAQWVADSRRNFREQGRTFYRSARRFTVPTPRQFWSSAVPGFGFKPVAGFGWSAFRGSADVPPRITAVMRGVCVPYWVPAMLLAAVPAAWVRSFRRRRWARRCRERGLCLRCGYDLRASQGHCPECGMSAEGS